MTPYTGTPAQIAERLLDEHRETMNWDEGDLVLLETRIAQAIEDYAKQDVPKQKEQPIDLSKEFDQTIKRNKRLEAEWRKNNK